MLGDRSRNTVSRYSDVLSGVCAKNTGLGGVRVLWCVMHPSTGIFRTG